VRLLIGCGRPYEQICPMIINPSKGKPIGPELFVKVFAREIEVGRIEMDTIVAASMAGRIRKGSDTMIIWYTKNRWGWRDAPEPTPRVPARGDEYEKAGGERKVVVVVEGGLPSGSTPENPGGDNYPEVPPEESVG
jgi:hypothetical protein